MRYRTNPMSVTWSIERRTLVDAALARHPAASARCAEEDVDLAQGDL